MTFTENGNNRVPIKQKSKKISKNKKDKVGLTPTIQTIEDNSDRFSANEGISDDGEKYSEQTPVMGIEPEESNFSNMKCAIDDPATNFSLGYSRYFYEKCFR